MAESLRATRSGPSIVAPRPAEAGVVAMRPRPTPGHLHFFAVDGRRIPG